MVSANLYDFPRSSAGMIESRVTRVSCLFCLCCAFSSARLEASISCTRFRWTTWTVSGLGSTSDSNKKKGDTVSVAIDESPQ